MVQITPHTTAFAVPVDHPLRDAHQWLVIRLESLAGMLLPTPPWTDPAAPRTLCAQLLQEPAAAQITILLACVERMVWHRREQRANPQHPTHFAVGSLLYTLACTLYQRRLPYTEAQICTLLHLSRHHCGHGEDVIPPYRIALRYARRAGLTPTLLAALQEFIAALPWQRGTHASVLRSRANLLFILAPRQPRGHRRCWSDTVREGLQRLPVTECQAWTHLIVHMSVHNRSSGTRAWQAVAQDMLHTIWAAQIVDRLRAWWPDPASETVWPLTPAGSHLLKHCIWLLRLIPSDAAVQPQATRLVCDLAALDWRRQSAGQKVMRAACTYLCDEPPPVSWVALQHVQRWSRSVEDTTHPDKIDMMIEDYQTRYPEVGAALP